MARTEALNIGEIREALRAAIQGVSEPAAPRREGSVLRVGDGIVAYAGLPQQLMGEVVEIATAAGPVPALALNLLEDEVGAVVLGDDQAIAAGAGVTATGRLLTVPVGDHLLGRVVDALGRPIDGSGPIKATKTRPVESPAPDVMSRRSVHQPLATGLLAIDAVTPIGRGQRQLIIGDRGTGKTAIAIDTIINQTKQKSGVISIYVAIGQKTAKVARLIERLRASGALERSIVVVASAADAAALQYIAPYAATAMAEEIRDSGGDALIIYDDLTKHAQAYRQLSLLLRRPPGREAFPGDVFYLHSRLLERSAKLSNAKGGGSLTGLPIIETQAGDVSAYIPTNVISITDGQIFLDTDLFYQGVRPAINVGLSVSRVGGAAQVAAVKKLAGSLRINLAQYREVAAFGQFSTDLDADTRQRLTRGERMTAILKQPQYTPLSVAEQTYLLLVSEEGRFDDIPLAEMPRVVGLLLGGLSQHHAAIVTRLNTTGVLSDEDRVVLLKAATRVTDGYRSALNTHHAHHAEVRHG
jgi:F-type H+-transporting ATPase subunit alpha